METLGIQARGQTLMPITSQEANTQLATKSTSSHEVRSYAAVIFIIMANPVIWKHQEKHE